MQRQLMVYLLQYFKQASKKPVGQHSCILWVIVLLLHEAVGLPVLHRVDQGNAPEVAPPLDVLRNSDH